MLVKRKRYPNKAGAKGKITKNQIKSNQLKCMYANMRSVMNNNKREEINLLLIENKIDILGITESWTHEGIEDGELQFSGYTMFRRDRAKSEKEKGGGVLLYVRESLGAVREMEDVGYKCESVWVKILDNVKNEIYVGLFYKSPNSRGEEVEAMFEQIKAYSKNQTVIIGDFNYPDINWKLRDSGILGRDFLELINDCFLWQHILAPTRGTNILDLILSTEENMIEEVEVNCPVSNSDHNLVTFQLICCTVEEISNKTNYRYDKANFQKIKEGLKEVDWENKLKGENVEDMWGLIKEELIQKRNMFVPIAKHCKITSPKWMSKGI